jgi:hypothetical protein
VASHDKPLDLGRHVGEDPDDLTGLRERRGVPGAGDAEVRQPSSPIHVDQDVGRLDIAVDDALSVDVGERPEQPASEPDQVELAGPPGGDPLGERVAPDQLHDPIRTRPPGPEVENPHKAGMAQTRGHPRLALEPPPIALIPREHVRRDLHRHLAPETLVTRHPHGRHPAASEPTQQP